MSAALAVDRSLDALGGGAPFAGKYTVERILGHGGMGTVFEARHLRLGHRVAIKVLGSELRDYPELVTRFEREARAAGSLTSVHAVRVFDIDMTEDATPFIVMELLSGSDLARILESEGPQPVPRAVKWVVEACDAIGEAHRLGIIHRDIKPSNLFLASDGVKVLDFGIAKRVAAKEASITHAVAPLGTPQYMSPEQVRCAKNVDARTDVWSLGVTLYELVAGRTPFEHEVSAACIASIAADPVPDPREFVPSLPASFVAVLMRALAKDPKERHQTVEELVTDLAPFLDGTSTDAAVRRVVDRAATAVRAEDSTLDGELVELEELIEEKSLFESGVRCPVKLQATKPTKPESDDPEASVPPAVSRVPVRKVGHVSTRGRWKSPFTVASAAVLGLVALVVTPRCVSRLDAAPSTAVVRASAPTATTATAKPAAPPAVVQPQPQQAEPSVETHADVQPAQVQQVQQPTQAPKKPVATKPKQRDVSIRYLSSDNNPVHGGLSNPGL